MVPIRYYLMLDKDNIGQCCGRISTSDLIQEVGSSRKVHNIVDRGKVFRNKYILIEDFETAEEDELRKDKLILDSGGKHYYGTYDGKFYVLMDRDKTVSDDGRRLAKYRRKAINGELKIDANNGQQIYMVDIDRSEIPAASVIAKLYDIPYSEGDIIYSRNGNPEDVSAENIGVCKKEKYESLMDKRQSYSSSSRPVGYFRDGELVDIFPSAKSAARNLYCDEKTIRNYCNGKIRRKSIDIDIRWMPKRKIDQENSNGRRNIKRNADC